MHADEKLMELCFPEGMVESAALQLNPPATFMYLLPESTWTALGSINADVFTQEFAGPSMCFLFLQCNCQEEMTVKAQNKENGIFFLFDIRGEAKWSVAGHNADVSCIRGQQCAFSAPAGSHRLSLKPGLHQHIIVCISSHLSGLLAGEWPVLSPLFDYTKNGGNAPLVFPSCIYSQASSDLVGDLATSSQTHWSLWKAVEQTVYFLLGNYASQISSLQQRKQSGGAILRKKAQQYIQAHYLKPGLNKAAVADALYVSVSTLEKAFKGSAVNIHDFILILRLLKAREWLYLTDRPVKDIAMELGFFDASYFNKVFKKRFFMTAGQCRKDGLELRNGKNA